MCRFFGILFYLRQASRRWLLWEISLGRLRFFIFFWRSISWRSWFSFRKIIIFKVFAESVLCQIWCSFGLKKLSQNPSKTRSEPLQNRWQKRVVFQHRFFGVSTSILEGLGLPFWSQVCHCGYKNTITHPPLSDLRVNVLSKWRLGGLQARF